MCGSCGFPSAAGHWTEAGSASTAHDRLRARFRRVQVLRSILPAYGLTAHDDALTPGIVVGNMTGNQVIAADLSELWTVAERLGSQSIDPLDPRFTDATCLDVGEAS